MFSEKTKVNVKAAVAAGVVTAVLAVSIFTWGFVTRYKELSRHESAVAASDFASSLAAKQSADPPRFDLVGKGPTYVKMPLKSTPQIQPGELLRLAVNGLTLEQVKKAATTYYPRGEALFYPAATWEGDPLVFFMARKKGVYLIGIYSAGPDGSVVKTETEVLVGDGDNPTPPEPPQPPQPPTPPDPPVPPKVQKIWTVVIENSLIRTPFQEDAEEAAHDYATTSQEGRWKRLDRNQVDTDGKTPKGFERFVAAWKKACEGTSDQSPRMFIVGESGKILAEQVIPAGGGKQEIQEIVTLLKKYGG
jgi:hypothetical protein